MLGLKKLYIYILIMALSLKLVYNICYLTYYQFNTENITLAFCENKEKVALACNGKCHLAKQIQSNETSEDDRTLKVQTEIFSALFFQKNSFLNWSTKLLHLNKSVDKRYIANYTYNFATRYFRPPIV